LEILEHLDTLNRAVPRLRLQKLKFTIKIPPCSKATNPYRYRLSPAVLQGISMCAKLLVRNVKQYSEISLNRLALGPKKWTGFERWLVL
jgi:hypothetical protein